ncbi:MAG: 2-oxo acid dehydrogenase subunit E2 [Armatimonadetes bacterium]|nr:2-oxo acid dehydrogenase subunit E2 [Armatimonadota bacterium]
MPTISVNIPQIGEGLQEARLVAVLKQPGEKVRRDEPIYQMETDKAVMDVESPYEGTLVEWLAPVDTILPIGGAVAKMDVADGVQEVGAGGHGAPASAAAAAPAAAAASSDSSAGARNANIPPRTRAYAKEKGIGEDDLNKLAASSGGKLTPADIDAFLNGSGGGVSAPAATGAGGPFTEAQLSSQQRLLSSRLIRGNQLVVPGTISVAVNWEPILAAREKSRAQGGDFQPSTFTMFAYAVSKCVADFPAFKTTLVGDSTLRTYKGLSLGVAVSLPGDELVLAVVENADNLSWREFANQAREKIELARGGKDQANEAVTLSLTNMQNFGLRDAVPVVVPPSMATLFLGEIYNGLDPEAGGVKVRKTANLALTFDHRLLNGVGAANFINAVRKACENIDSLIG